MKKIFYYFAFTIVLMSTIASSCKKPKDEKSELPTGENTMYYYVDGVLHIPKGQHIGGVWEPAISYSVCLHGGSFDLVTLSFFIHFYNGIQSTGPILLNQGHYDSCQVLDNHAIFVKKELGSDGILHNIDYYTHDGSGTINITYLSADKRKFKGTFEMTVYHENTNAEIHITDGHFNINLDTLNK